MGGKCEGSVCVTSVLTSQGSSPISTGPSLCLLSHVSRPASLAAHLPAINRCANRFVAQLAQRVAAPAAAHSGKTLGEEGIDMFSIVGGYTMAVTGEVAYG